MRPIYKSIYKYVLPLLMAVAVACGEIDGRVEGDTVDSAQQLAMSLRSTDRLFTTEYVIRKCVTYDDVVKLRGKLFNQEFEITPPQGQRKLIIPMEAIVKAYVDFSDFSADNVRFDADSSHIYITLPEPKLEMTSTHIDQRRILSLTSYGRSNFSQQEIAEYERQGREAIIQAIPDMDLLETARAQSYNVILPMVLAMGYTPDQVTIEFDDQVNYPDIIKNLTIKD